MTLDSETHVVADLIYTYTHPPSKVHLTHPKGVYTHTWGHLNHHQNLEITQNTPNTAAFSKALFCMVKIMLWWRLSILAPTPLHEFNSPISRDTESHMWGRLGPHQNPEAILNTPNTAIFFIVHLWNG